MALSYETFMKHAAKVVANETAAMRLRPQISGIYHQADGSAIVTDAHRLYVARGIHERHDEVILSPAGKRIDGTYPDVKRVIPSGNPKQAVSLHLDECLHVAETVQTLGDLYDIDATVEFKDNEIRYQSDEVKYRHTVPVEFEIRTCLRSSYLVDALKLMKAAGCHDIKLSFYGSNRPVISEFNNLTILISPIRTY
ncbi:hypothetical protein CVD25_00965 [Bacillus canaveralius]|uniref:DNA polymerase III beta sliding clamp central domain-containing protein n=1 Tax=Bacillus canaveralius TaxID=1403243 RepID=A0A2N5GPK0_9BACI|nr:hypothetical protein [Bacillus canaveralius]PLR84637.1 hypothetical protein CU635_06075 [Bacillus canaveralius]PLS00789.1 hypothetical protein CVD25_00965 [Bacillus canaveralius]